MIPEKVLSTVVLASDFLAPDDVDSTPWIDYEMGGVGLNDPSQGLQVKTWVLRFVSPDLRLSAAGSPETTLFQAPGLTELSLAFDQNMRPAIAYVQSGEAKLYWYDSFIESVTTTVLPAGTITPRVCLDDKRTRMTGSSDVILAYVRNDNLYFRAQRDRFEVEYLLKAAVGGTLIRVGMNTVNRLQFKLQANT